MLRAFWYIILSGYVYWRLLSTNPEQAKQIVLAEKPVIEVSLPKIPPTSREVATSSQRHS
jgi:hypothetical protein